MSLPILCKAISSVNVANLCFQTQLVFVFHDMFSTIEYSGFVSSSNWRYITLAPNRRGYNKEGAGIFAKNT